MICAELDAAQAGDVPATEARRTAQPQLRVFACDHDTRIKFIADGLPVQIGRLAETAFFETQGHAEGVAAACATILSTTPGGAADADGWHRTPKGARLSTFLPTLLHAARNRDWTAPADQEAVDEPLSTGACSELPQGLCDTTIVFGRKKRWDMRRVAWLGFLIGRGWTAKRIAEDELIRTSPNNVHQQAFRFGLSLSAVPQGQVCLDLPAATLVAFDKAAAAAHLQRDAFIQRLLIRAASDPARYGLVVVS